MVIRQVVILNYRIKDSIYFFCIYSSYTTQWNLYVHEYIRAVDMALHSIAKHPEWMKMSSKGINNIYTADDVPRIWFRNDPYVTCPAFIIWLFFFSTLSWSQVDRTMRQKRKLIGIPGKDKFVVNKSSFSLTSSSSTEVARNPLTTGDHTN